MRRLAARFVMTLVTALAAASALAADATGAADARSTFAALVEIEGQQPPHVNGTAEAMAENAKAIREWQTKRAEADTKFRAAFAAADWASWKPTEDHPDDARVLERGLLDVGEAAIVSGDGEKSVKAFDGAAALPAPSADAARRIADGRPAAYFVARAFDKAREIAAAVAAKAGADDLPSALTRQGDVECALGRLDEARAFYGKATKAAESDGMTFGRAAVAAMEAQWKLGHVGTPLGDLAPQWTLGTDGGKPPELGGSTIALVFPDPYNAERFETTASARLAGKGARTVGVFSSRMTMCLAEAVMDYPPDSFPRVRGEPQPDGLRGWAERFARRAHTDFRLIGVAPQMLPLGKSVLGSAIVVDAKGVIAYFRAPGEPVAFAVGAVERLATPR